MFDRISGAPGEKRSITSMFAIMTLKANGAVPQVAIPVRSLTAPSAKDPGANRLQATRAFISVPRFESQSFKVRGDSMRINPVLGPGVVSDGNPRRPPAGRGRLVLGHIVLCPRSRTP